MTVDELKNLPPAEVVAYARNFASQPGSEFDWLSAHLLIIDMADRIESLAKFKAYVHLRLDEAGVPADPDSPHKAEGCRIGGRLDIVLASNGW